MGFDGYDSDEGFVVDSSSGAESYAPSDEEDQQPPPAAVSPPSPKRRWRSSGSDPDDSTEQVKEGGGGSFAANQKAKTIPSIDGPTGYFIRGREIRRYGRRGGRGFYFVFAVVL